MSSNAAADLQAYLADEAVRADLARQMQRQNASSGALIPIVTTEGPAREPDRVNDGLDDVRASAVYQNWKS